MKKVFFALLLVASVASAEVTIRNGAIWFNGVRQEQVWGRSSFKLSNIVTYHFTGRGGGDVDPATGKYSLGYALEWVRFNKLIFGDRIPVLRVFLETGWPSCDTENGAPNNCMFGSEPRDQGFWDRNRLRDGNRETEVHPVGRQVLEWFFATSQTENVAFELVIDATLKHDNVPKGEIDHVIRQVGVLMGQFAEEYPQALIIPNGRNEIFAHNQAGHTLNEINQWAVRWDRDHYWDGAPFIVDQAAERFDYDVGPEDGKFRIGLIHPPRGANWENWPTIQNAEQMKADSRGMPWGANESMYYVEPEDEARARNWYGGGWTSDWQKYEGFLSHVLQSEVDYMIIHDEKGSQSDPNWPRSMTRVDEWISFNLGGFVIPPEPEPVPDPIFYFDPIIEGTYQLILGRSAQQEGLDVYNPYMRQCVPEFSLPICIDQLEKVLFNSEEYHQKYIY